MTKVLLVDRVGNGARHETAHKVLPMTLSVLGRLFVRTGETAGDVMVYRLQDFHTGARKPEIRHIDSIANEGEQAA